MRHLLEEEILGWELGQWDVPVVPATEKAKTRGSLELRIYGQLEQ